LGSLLGLGAALVQRGGNLYTAGLVSASCMLLRSLPEVLIIFVVYYGFSFLLQSLAALFGISAVIMINPFLAGLLSIGLIHGAYASEVFGGAFAAVPKGQLEAAAALGLKSFARFRLIELPQACRYALPGLINLSIMAIKVTPFLSAIGLRDLLRTASDAGKNTKDYVVFYSASIVLYLVVAALLYFAQIGVESRLAASSRTV
jgi:ABC-type arginine transport system permease subunit